jgi:hypothetical protein
MRDMAEYMRGRRSKIALRVNGKMLQINANDLLQINKILLHCNAETLQSNGNVLQINICENSETCENGSKTAFSSEMLQVNGSRGGEGGVLFDNIPSTPNDAVTSNIYNKEKNKTKKEKSCENHNADFEIFWQAWPSHFRKADKKGTFEKYCKALRETAGLTAEKLLKALEWHKKSRQWQKDDGQYIPAPAVWLNGCKWEACENAAEPSAGHPAAFRLSPPVIEERREAVGIAELAAAICPGYRKQGGA